MNARKNIVLGSFLVGGLLFLTTLTFFLKGTWPWTTRTDWTAYFGKDSVIQEGWEVVTAGKKVGLVKSVELVPEAEIAKGRFVQATLRIDKDVVVWKGAEVVLTTRGLLGRSIVQLVRGDHREGRLSPDTPLKGRIVSDLISELRQMVTENREGFTKTVAHLEHITAYARQGKGTVGRLVYDEELAAKMSSVLDDFSTFTSAVNDPRTTLGALLRKDDTIIDDLKEAVQLFKEAGQGIKKGALGELTADISRTVTKIEDQVDRIRRGEGTIGLLLTDKDARKKIEEGIESLHTFAQSLNQEGTLQELLKNREIYDRIDNFSRNLLRLTEEIEAGKGTLGMLLKDERAYNELLRMLEALREGGEIARENAPLSSFTSFASLFFNVIN